METLYFTIYAVAAMTFMYVGLKSIRNRFLPIARPVGCFSLLLIVVCVAQMLGFYGFDNKYLAMLQATIELFAPLIGQLFLLWMLLEYYFSAQLGSKWLVAISVLPVIVALTFIFNVGSLFLYPGSEAQLIFTAVDGVEGFWQKIRILRLSFAVALLAFVGYAVRVKTRNNNFELFLVLVILFIPGFMMFLKASGVLTAKLGVVSWSLLLLWGTRQYRLLDPMPMALPSIMQGIQNGLAVINPQKKVVYSNQYARKLLNMDPLTPDRSRQPQVLPAILDANFQFNEKQLQTAFMSILVEGEDPKERFIEAQLEPLSNHRGQHFGFTLALHDLTYQRESTRKLESLNKELHQLNQQRSIFFANISHEFRTPLTLSLGTLSDVLNGLHGSLPRSLNSPVLSIQNSNAKLLQLVNQLLDLAKLDANGTRIEAQHIDLQSYLPHLITMFEASAKRQQVSLDFNCDFHKGDFYFDLDAFDKVIFNLLSNALKSMPQGGRIDIYIEEVSADWIEISVQDTGCGIPEPALDKIFEPYYCSDDAAYQGVKGTGIGLALASQLVKLHQGSISAESVLDQGSLFRLQLRRGTSHFEPNNIVNQDQVATVSSQLDVNQSKPTSIDATTSTPEKLVLVVEDNAEMRQYIRFHLGAEYRLLEAADGEEGLLIAQQQLPDLIVADIMMPKTDGLTLCREVKQGAATSHIPVVLLTAKSHQDDKIAGLLEGADAYLNKPFDAAELVVRINNLVDGRAKLKANYLRSVLASKLIDIPLPQKEVEFLNNIKHFLSENIAKENLYTSDIADAVSMSERSLNRKLKALTGETPKQLLQSVRLEHTAQLLNETQMTVSEICHSTGFSDASYFTRKFKQRFSKTPSQYRESC